MRAPARRRRLTLQNYQHQNLYIKNGAEKWTDGRSGGSEQLRQSCRILESNARALENYIVVSSE